MLEPTKRALLVLCLALAGCDPNVDEARFAKRPVESLLLAGPREDYFRDMDQDKNGRVALTDDEIQGRNTWLLWSGGDDRLWNLIAERSEGSLDLLKTVSRHPALDKLAPGR